MPATSPDEAILFARFTGEEKSHRDAALAVLQSEILNHLKQRKLGMGLHDLENAAKHLIEQLQKPQSVAFSNWNEVRTHAFAEAVLRANEDKLWLTVYPQLHTETLKVLISNRYNLPEAELVAVTDDSILKVRELNPALVAKPDELKRFLFAVAKNKALDKLKANGAAIRGGNKVDSIEELDPGKEIAEGQVEAHGFDVASGENHPGEALMAKEKRHTLWQAICKMPKKHAQIFLDLHLHRMKHHEVAAKHGLKIGSIGVYNRRAIEMLTVILAGTIGVLMLMFRYLGPSEKGQTVAENNNPSAPANTNGTAVVMNHPGNQTNVSTTVLAVTGTNHSPAGFSNVTVIAQNTLPTKTNAAVVVQSTFPAKTNAAVVAKTNQRHFFVQFAQIYVGGELMRGVSSTTDTNLLATPQMTQGISEAFGTNFQTFAVESDSQQIWLAHWNARPDMQTIKIAYDADNKTVRILANEAGNTVTILSRHVENVSELQTLLPTLRQAIEDYMTKK